MSLEKAKVRDFHQLEPLDMTKLLWNLIAKKYNVYNYMIDLRYEGKCTH